LPAIDAAADRAPDHAAPDHSSHDHSSHDRASHDRASHDRASHDRAARGNPAELGTANAGATAELVFPGGHRLALLHMPPHEIAWIELDPRASGERRVEVRTLGGRGLVAVLSLGEQPALRYAATPLLSTTLGLGGGCYEPPGVRVDM
ncbi:MAG: hypothetical protein JNL50_03450, partial [Phycisphaerae bacterium]|nr:hypothetical protein [Phycisphaerae bacterium]